MNKKCEFHVHAENQLKMQLKLYTEKYEEFQQEANNLKIVLLAFLLYQELPSFGQGCSAISARVSPSPTSPPRRDTTVCKGSNLNIFVNIPTVLSTTSYTVSSIPYIDTLPCESAGSLVAGSGINIDDGYSAVQSIGFNFCFYGNPHNQLQICDNGFLTFSVNKPVLGTLTAPFIVQSLPLAANPNPASGATTLPPNSILGAWMDAYLVTGGSNRITNLIEDDHVAWPWS